MAIDATIGRWHANRAPDITPHFQGGHASGEGGAAAHGYASHDPVIISDDESEATEDEDEDDEDGGVGHAGEETESEGSDGGHGHDSDDESFVNEEQRGPKLRVREILFYEERVEAFRRRHGVLRP